MRKLFTLISVLSLFLTASECRSQWYAQTSGTSAYISSIHFENDMTGWITGTSGAVIRKTTNGGVNWSTQPSGLSFGSLNSVFFVDPLTGWIVGNQYYDSTIILKTTNGGNNWKFVNQGGGKIFYCTYFVNMNTGWAVGESSSTYNGIIYKTTNGGTNWFQQSVVPTSDFLACFFLNENTGWVGGTNTFASTSNGGLSWDTVGLNLVTRGLYFIDPLVGFMAENSSKVYKTTDGGLTWNISCNGNGTIYSVFFINPFTGWACGVGGKIYRTSDIGTSWVVQNTPVTSQLTSIFFVSPLIGYSAGSNGVILKTINGGESLFTTQTIHRYNINKPILAGQNTLDTINVVTNSPYVGFTYDVNVYLDTIYNDINGNLEIMLLHQGITDTIVYRVGGNGSNFFRTVLNDSALIPIEGGTPPFIGQYRPSRPLAQFNNLPTDGLWILKIYNRVKDVNPTGVIKSWGITVSYSPNVGIKKVCDIMPDKSKLYQNYPNPFNPATNIKYRIKENSYVSLKVFDILGREVAVLVKEKLQPGIYEAQFRSDNLPSGVYFSKLECKGQSDYSETKRMVLLK